MTGSRIELLTSRADGNIAYDYAFRPVKNETDVLLSFADITPKRVTSQGTRLCGLESVLHSLEET